MVEKFHFFLLLLIFASCSHMEKNVTFPDTSLPGIHKAKVGEAGNEIEIHDEKVSLFSASLESEIIVIMTDESYSSFCLPYILKKVNFKKGANIFINLGAQPFLSIYFKDESMSKYSWQLFRAAHESFNYGSMLKNIIANQEIVIKSGFKNVTLVRPAGKDAFLLKTEGSFKKYFLKNLNVKKKIISLEDNLYIDDKMIGKFENHEKLRSLPSFCEKLKI